jgi:DNA-binding transcriptional MerR regulator
MTREADLRLTIGELAEAAGMTVRNVRNHRWRGLIGPPVLVARTGYYGREHLERLKLIRAMQAEGFNLEAISCLLGGGGATAPPIAADDLAERLDVSPAAARHAAVAMRGVAALFDRALERGA